MPLERGTVLLTGAAGFLGRHCVAALREDGWRVLCAGRVQGNDRSFDVLLDLDRPEDMFATLAAVKFDAIVHLAAKVGWPDKTDAELFTPNVLSTGVLAEMARRKAAKLVIASAAIVHGVRSTHIKSDSPEFADTAYGKSKLRGDDLVKASGARHCIVRFGGLFGLDGPSHLGLNKAIGLIVDGKPPVIFGRGSAQRNYLYVRDAANALVAALREGIEGVHLCAGSETLSIGRMLRMACDILAPGLAPLYTEGSDATDQIIESSPDLPQSRSFSDAVRDIGSSVRRCA